MISISRKCALFLIVTLLMLVESCSKPILRPPSSTWKPLKAVQILERWREKSLYWHTFYARYRVTLTRGQAKASFMVSATVYKFFKCRAEVTSFWGRTYALLIVNDKDNVLWIPSQKTVYISSSSEPLLESLLRVRINLTTLLALLNGCIPREQIKNRVTMETGSSEIMFSYKENGQNFYWIFRRSPPALTALFITLSKERSSRYTAVYQPEVKLALDAMPEYVLLETGNCRLKIKLLAIDRLRSVNQALFEFVPPSGSKKVFITRS